MKVLLLNGSPHTNGCCKLALEEMISVFNEKGVETEIVEIGSRIVPGCIACGYCHSHKDGCVRHDIVDEVNAKFRQSDGIVIASPVYYASANGTLISFLDRLFYSGAFSHRMKVGCAVVSCRRGGASATFDEINKYFTIAEMPIVSSIYWNSIHGHNKEEALQDLEGRSTMRQLARNMTFLMNAIQREKEENGLPDKEDRVFTNFIR